MATGCPGHNRKKPPEEPKPRVCKACGKSVVGASVRNPVVATATGSYHQRCYNREPARPGGVCEVCLDPFVNADLEDGVTLSADCCGRTGLCRRCRKKNHHDCD